MAVSIPVSFRDTGTLKRSSGSVLFVWRILRLFHLVVEYWDGQFVLSLWLVYAVYDPPSRGGGLKGKEGKPESMSSQAVHSDPSNVVSNQNS
jgi:hypothetical protein